MKIIDFEINGNQVKFYVGSDYCNDYYGDDWDDRPYEHNAGPVYGEYVIGWFVKTFDFDDVVMEPCNGHDNSSFCKLDMREGKVPCVVVLPKEYKEEYCWYYSFEDISGNKNAIKYFFNDKVDENLEKIHYIKTIGNEDLYINFCIDKTSYEEEKVVRLASTMFSDTLKYMAHNMYLSEIDEDGFKELEPFIKTDALKQFEEFINISAKVLKTDFNYNVKSVLTNSRQICRDGYLNVSICYLSDDNFKIGNIEYKYNR